MSRDLYGGASQRSPKPARRGVEMATLHGSGQLQSGSLPSKQHYASISQPPSARGSPITGRTLSSSPSHLQQQQQQQQQHHQQQQQQQQSHQGRKVRHYGISRSSNSSPLTLPAEPHVPHSYSSGAFISSHGGYYSGDDQLGSPIMDSRSAAGGGSHRSRSATRGPLRSYHSMERDQERDFMPVREPRERSLDRVDMSASTRHSRSRERSLDRSYRDRVDMVDHGAYRETAIDSDPYRDNMYIQRNSHGGTNPADSRHNYSRDSFIMELQSRLNELQNQYGTVKRELDATTQKLGSSMHSIKTFWSPELKKERALRKEEAAKYSLINDQLKILRAENQKQSSLMRQMEDELRASHMRNPDAELQQHLEALYAEKDHMGKEIYLLRETVKELELRIETQKQTLSARDESIKKLMEMLQTKGTVGGKLLEEERLELERLRTRLIESETRSRHFESILDSKDKDLNKVMRLNRNIYLGDEITNGYDDPEDQALATLEAIIETKDARIATLEGEVDLLEHELSRMKESHSLTSLSSSISSLDSRAAETLEVTKHIEQQAKSKMEELRMEVNKRDQEILAMGAKMKTLEEQHQDYQRHIAVLKESLCAKEEHYNMLQADVEELRQRLEEKNKLIEKRTQQSMTTTQDRNRLTQELQELRDHMDIKDRKINVLQRKIENLEDLLKEKDNQVDMARARLTAMQAHHSSSEGALSSLEEAISDKEKQITQLREQRDRAEQERNEERELHEREVAEYKMKMHAMESEMEKLQADLQKLQGQQQQAAARGSKEASAELAALQKQGAEFTAMQKQLDERQRSVDDVEKKLKKRKEKLDQMETQLQQASTGNSEVASKQMNQLRERCAQLEQSQATKEKEISQVKEDAKHSQTELERLLQIMGNTEEEKFTLNNTIRELQEALKERDAKLNSLKRNQQSDKTRSAQMLEEARKRETDVNKEANKAQELVQQHQDRIVELEDALRESVHITAQSEIALVQKETLFRAAEEKIGKLHGEVRSLQSAQNARCTNCPPMKVRLKELEVRTFTLMEERRKHLEDLFDLKHEALSAAISEKDAHLALLEVSGIKTAQTAEGVDRLRTEKKKLMDKLKTENANRVKILSELGDRPVATNGKLESTSNSGEVTGNGLES